MELPAELRSTHRDRDVANVQTFWRRVGVEEPHRVSQESAYAPLGNATQHAY